MKKSVVLLSAGLDSSVNFLWALRESEVVLALTFDYGQRAREKEIAAARQLAAKFKVPHRVIQLPFFGDFTATSLVNTAADIPRESQVSIDDYQTSVQTAAMVWVPNRNGIFLNIAAGFAEGLKADWIIPGFNLEEATTFPDNSEAYLQVATRALSFSTANHVQVKCFTTAMNKTEIAAKGRELGLDFSGVWPCYFGGETPCGECESCKRFARATGLRFGLRTEDEK
ncbi:MAG: 7-cyano-7-deazaguanine synthase QueC [Bdellovibrionaceae bacterium]|nr:7-cyano-7-deazaguanine synthase QueC [Pseudobdellovibrionaceae bacterium]